MGLVYNFLEDTLSGSLGLESEGVWGGQGGRFRKAGKRGATENPPARRRESPKLGGENLGLQELSGGGERVSEDGLETRVHLGWVPLDCLKDTNADVPARNGNPGPVA